MDDDDDDSFAGLFGGSDTTATDFSSTGTVSTASTSQAQSNASAWGSLDSLGSTATGVASSILSALGANVTGQVNNATLLQATGAQTAALTAAAAANPNQWQTFLYVGLALAGAVLIYKAVKG